MTVVNVSMRPNRVMLDTNVILSATDEGGAEHGQARLIFNNWPGHGTTLYASGQIMREYLAVATRPADKNGLGLEQADALANVRAFRTRTSLLSEDSKVADCLIGLLDETRCAGKQVHDANVVATMLVHGIDSLITMNLGDFVRFEHHIKVISLASIN